MIAKSNEQVWSVIIVIKIRSGVIPDFIHLFCSPLILVAAIPGITEIAFQ